MDYQHRGLELVTYSISSADDEPDIFCGILVTALDATRQRVEHDELRRIGQLPDRSDETADLASVQEMYGSRDELDAELAADAVALLPRPRPTLQLAAALAVHVH